MEIITTNISPLCHHSSMERALALAKDTGLSPVGEPTNIMLNRFVFIFVIVYIVLILLFIIDPDGNANMKIKIKIDMKIKIFNQYKNIKILMEMVMIINVKI